jgi:hypothetical protein
MIKEGDEVSYRNPLEKIHYEGVVVDKLEKENRITISVEKVYSGKEVSVAYVENDSRLEKIK